MYSTLFPILFQALVINEFRGERFDCDAQSAATVGCTTTGEQVIDQLSFQVDRMHIQSSFRLHCSQVCYFVVVVQDHSACACAFYPRNIQYITFLILSYCYFQDGSIALSLGILAVLIIGFVIVAFIALLFIKERYIR